MGAKSSSAPPPDPRLVEGQLKSMGIQDSLITQYMDYQKQLTPIQMEEMKKGIERADAQYTYDTTRQDRLDKQATEQFGFTMDYNKAALASQAAAAGGANAAAMANASANGMTAASNARLADSSIKMNDYQYAQMQERDKRWREVGIPQEDALIAKVNEMGSEKYRDQQLGIAVGDVNQAVSDARGQTIRAAQRAGIDPNSGAFAKMMMRGNADQGLALAGAKNNTRTRLAQTDLAQKFQLNGAMKGMSGMGDMSANLAINAIGAGKQGYGPGGGGGGGGGFGAMGFGGGGGGGGSGPNAGAGLSIANAGAGGILGGYQTGAGMAGGMGSNATSMWNAQAGYKTAQDQHAGEGFGALLGAGAKLGAAWLGMPSDRRLKTNVEFVGQDVGSGLNLYQFSYLSDPDRRRYQGVMADEVAKVMPSAVRRHADGYDRVNYQAIGLEMMEV